MNKQHCLLTIVLPLLAVAFLETSQAADLPNKPLKAGEVCKNVCYTPGLHKKRKKPKPQVMPLAVAPLCYEFVFPAIDLPAVPPVMLNIPDSDLPAEETPAPAVVDVPTAPPAPEVVVYNTPGGGYSGGFIGWVGGVIGGGTSDTPSPPGSGLGAVHAPEIDPASATSALTLLLGSLTVVVTKSKRQQHKRTNASF